MFTFEVFSIKVIAGDSGYLSVVEFQDLLEHYDFKAKRIYWLHGVESNVTRGGHSHKKLRQLFIPIKGGCEIEFDDGKVKKTEVLIEGKNSIFIEPGLWRELKNFKPNSILLVLADEVFDENDYIRDYKKFLELKNYES